MLLRLTKQFTFEMAHALPDYQGKCHNIHGHSYKLYVTVEGGNPPVEGSPANGMVMDFHAIKQLVEDRIIQHILPASLPAVSPLAHDSTRSNYLKPRPLVPNSYCDT